MSSTQDVVWKHTERSLIKRDVIKVNFSIHFTIGKNKFYNPMSDNVLWKILRYTAVIIGFIKFALISMNLSEISAVSFVRVTKI